MNYIGSKLSLLNFIESVILKKVQQADISKMVFADLFSGTCTVAAHFKNLGFNIIGNDLQYYSYIIGKHILENNDFLGTSKFVYFNSLTSAKGFIYNNYCEGSGSGRLYFSDENGLKCDAIRIEIERLRTCKEISDSEYYFYLASLINSIDKYANTASVYGAYLKKLKSSASKLFVIEPYQQIESFGTHKMYNENANDLIRHIEGDILYLDPPYNSRQYNANYHLLETIAKYDNPTIIGKTGLRKDNTTKSKYCSKRFVLGEFENLVEQAKFKYIFLSYNNEGLMSIKDIERVMSKYGKYSVEQKKYQRFKADKNENRNHKKDHTYEYIHCLKKVL